MNEKYAAAFRTFEYAKRDWMLANQKSALDANYNELADLAGLIAALTQARAEREELVKALEDIRHETKTFGTPNTIWIYHKANDALASLNKGTDV